MEELKKCPFCGGKAKVLMDYKKVRGITLWCQCEDCHTKTMGYCPKDDLECFEQCKEMAIREWNRRVGELKNYDPNIENGVHTVKITLQNSEYMGHIIQKISGTCKGRDMLDFNFENEEDSDLLPENDCQLEYNEDYNIFRCVLVNAAGGTLECEGDAEEMNDMIVAVEIMDFVEE